MSLNSAVPQTCMASKCMAWRWQGTKRHDKEEQITLEAAESWGVPFGDIREGGSIKPDSGPHVGRAVGIISAWRDASTGQRWLRIKVLDDKPELTGFCGAAGEI